MAEEYVVIRINRTSGTSRGSGPRRGGPTLGPSGTHEQTESLDVNVVTGRQALAKAKADPDVKASARSMPMKLIAPVSTKAVATEPSGAALAAKVAWGVHAVGADTSSFDGTGVVVAVLDTGIDRKHPAFKGVELIEKDFTGDGDGDVVGHGTHCAGTIFGRDVDGMRIGIARGVTKALIGKVIGNDGGTSAQIASAIQWAIENKASVISMSLGIDFPGYQAQLEQGGLRPEPATSLALEAYRQNLAVFDSVSELVASLARFLQPCLLIAAAGNESGRREVPPFEIAASPPAVSEGFVSVAALQEGPEGFAVADFSNIGAKVSGPGVGVISAKIGGGLISMDGTSMATPHVAGVAALWAQKLGQERKLTASQFSAELIASATTSTLHPSSTLEAVGAGIVRAPQ
jgi:subtilisin family serine protease